MDNTFQTLIGFKATDQCAESIGEYFVQVGATVRKNTVPLVLVQGGLPVAYEKELRTKSFVQVVAEHQKVEKDNSAPQPEQIPGMIVGLTLDTGTNTTASGSTIMLDRVIPYTHVQIASPDEKNVGFQMIYESIQPSPTVKIF
jgi:hypothetical protein